MAVTVSSVSLIGPAIPTSQPCWSYLCTSDLMLYRDTYTKVVYYFKPDRDVAKPFDVVVEELKRSLSLALVDYYILAGRVLKDKDGRMGVNCNDAGISFRVAYTTARFDDWDNVNCCSIEDELNAPDFTVTDLSQAPLIQFQVTEFACGGITFGVSHLEIVMDGFSALHFNKSWSEVHRGLKISPPSFDERSKLKARDPPTVRVPVRNYVTTSQAPEQADPDSEYAQEIFLLSTDKVGELILEIESGPYGYGRATSFEAMSALIWKSMTEARELPDTETTKFVYAMSLRGSTRWEPPLSENFFGNAVHVPILAGSAGEIKSRHVSYTARLLYEDIRGVSLETVKSCMDWMEENSREGLVVGYNFDIYGGRDVDCASLHSFPCYDVDFGWGKAIFLSMPMQPCFGGGAVMIFPTPQGGRSRHIHVQMPKEQMEKLLKTSLVKFATPIKGRKTNDGEF